MFIRGTELELRGGALRPVEDLEEHEEFLVGRVIYRAGPIVLEEAEWVLLICEAGGPVIGLSEDTLVRLADGGFLEAGCLAPGTRLYGGHTVEEIEPHGLAGMYHLPALESLVLRAGGLEVIG